MSKAHSAQVAPDSQQIIELLRDRLKGTRYELASNRFSNTAIPMLIDRVSPEMRQRLFTFIEERNEDDAVLAKGLITDHITRPYLIAAVVGTLDAIRKINDARESPSIENEVSEIREICDLLRLTFRDEELGEKDFLDIKATYFAAAVYGAPRWVPFDSPSTRLMQQKDFLDDAHLFIAPLMALMEVSPVKHQLSVAEVTGVTRMVRQHRSDGPRIIEAIRTHKGFDEALMDDLLASPRTPLESGVL